jgi:hypothetical protein
MAEPHCDSVKPGGNVAALTEKNPPPRKNHATRPTQRQTQRRDKFWLFDRLLFFTDPDFENSVGLARMLNPFLCFVFLSFLWSILPADSTPNAALRSQKSDTVQRFERHASERRF